METVSKKSRGALITKLRAACNGLPALLKNGQRTDYNYLRVTDLAEAVNEYFSKHGLLLIPNDLSFHESTCGGGDVFVKTEFILSDGKNSQSFVSLGSGRSSEGHALHIAQTVALKSWLKRLTLIFGEEDDAEAQPTRELPPRPTDKEIQAENRRIIQAKRPSPVEPGKPQPIMSAIDPNMDDEIAEAL